MIWARTYGAFNEQSPNQADILYGIAEARDGTIYVVGQWHGADFAHILRIEADGDTIGGEIYGTDNLATSPPMLPQQIEPLVVTCGWQ